MKIKYPLAKETINEEDIDALCEWLKGYPRLTKGDLTWEVEDAWANFIGTKRAVFNNSGSSANLLMVYTAMMAGRIKKQKDRRASRRLGHNNIPSHSNWDYNPLWWALTQIPMEWTWTN